MNELQVFSYEGKEVRTIQRNGETWWVLKDVCGVLELSNARMIADRLDEDDVSLAYVTDSMGRRQQTNIVNESGLYNVILRSDKPEAKKFKRWVTHEVLPQIRRHGAYITTSKLEEIMNDPDSWIKLLTALKEERQEKERLQLQVAQDKPKVVFADAVSVSDGTILIGELAKILKGNGIEIGQNRLFERLRQDGFLIKRKGTDYNAPTQKAMELGLFKVKETAITHSDGHVTISKTTKVTGKGQQYFVNYFLGGGADRDGRA
ncbi:phage antirepressor KilAC domain-containing protein [Pelotomaculum terephthalicicum JT]|jgi:anti-repressor protein|uniref:phage antirepressor n=1 Tax=Pelotomaculum terephthalicicum TaxID=206393 RepID=UPI001F04D2D2|nr:phage antirepressor KilAC domain-containing protein [Pelotomaculum terephthalicicum]MCG9967554.1 phage antirepressor KilAC domain-containing protein [Pelotomaculum terephthalicicum JT]